MTTVLILTLLALVVVIARLSEAVGHLRRIDDLLHGELERQHTERLAEKGRDRHGRFAKQT